MEIKMKKILFLILILSVSASAQQQHKFFSKGNRIRFTYCALGMAADAFSTQHFLADPRHRFIEGNPIARPLVSKGWNGQLAFSGGSYSAMLGISYLSHRWNHHKIEMLPSVIWGTTTFTAAALNNSRLK
jgi:hypothetical protein